MVVAADEEISTSWCTASYDDATHPASSSSISSTRWASLWLDFWLWWLTTVLPEIQRSLNFVLRLSMSVHSRIRRLLHPRTSSPTGTPFWKSSSTSSTLQSLDYRRPVPLERMFFLGRGTSSTGPELHIKDMEVLNFGLTSSSHFALPHKVPATSMRTRPPSFTPSRTPSS